MKRTNTLKILFAFILCANAGLIFAQTQTNDFKPSGNLWGSVFMDYYYKTHADSLGRGGSNVQYRGNQKMDAFQIRRAYLGYDYSFAKNISASIVLSHEEGPNGGASANAGTNLDANGYNTVMLKNMFLKWSNIFKGSNLIIGQMSTPSFATPFNSEQLGGYRSIEKTVMDMHNIDASTDIGVSLQGNLWKQNNSKDSLKPAIVGYQFMVGNGNSVKPENDRFKKWRATVYTSFMQQKITVGVYGDYNTVQLSPYLLTNTTVKGYAHFKTKAFSIGFEAFQQTNKNGDIYLATKTSTKADTATGAEFGWSVYGNCRLIKDKLNFFVRMDQFNPDTKFSSSNYKYSASTFGGNMTTTTFYKQTFYSIGFDYTPNGRLHIMPNLWLNQYKTMADSFLGVNVPGSRAKKDYDMVPRITLYYIFNK